MTGASGGIGSACARAFAAEGARVFVHYHRGDERARTLAGELGDAPTGQADLTVEATERVVGKVLDSEDQRRLVEEAVQGLDFSALEDRRS